MPIPRRLVSLIVTAGLASAVVTPAHATLVAGAYTVTGSNFTSAGGPPLPFSTIVENISFSFDNTTSFSQNTNAVTFISGTIDPASALGITYIQGADTSIIGGLASTVATADPASPDFALVLNRASSATPSVTSFNFSVGDGRVFTALTTSIVPYVAPSTGAVPEPASLLLVGAGLFGMRLLGRRRFGHG